MIRMLSGLFGVSSFVLFVGVGVGVVCLSNVLLFSMVLRVVVLLNFRILWWEWFVCVSGLVGVWLLLLLVKMIVFCILVYG